MSRRRRSLEDLDDLLPNELIETSSGSTVADLSSIVKELEAQMKNVIDQYESKIADLTDRLESIEKDFKQVVDALKSSGSSSGSPIPGPPG